MLGYKAPEFDHEVHALFGEREAWGHPTLITSLWLVRDRAVREGMLHHLLSAHPELANARHANGQSILRLAVQHQDVDAMRALLQHGAEVTADLVTAALPDAVAVRLLTSHVGDALGVMAPMTAPLEQALAHGYSACTAILRDQGALTAEDQRHLLERLDTLKTRLWGPGHDYILMRVPTMVERAAWAAAAGGQDVLLPQQVRAMLRALPPADTHVVFLVLMTILLVHAKDRAALLEYVLQRATPTTPHAVWATMLVAAGDLECLRVLVRHMDPQDLLRDLVLAEQLPGPTRLAMLEILLRHIVMVPPESLAPILNLALKHGSQQVLHMLRQKGLAEHQPLLFGTAAANIRNAAAIQMLVDEDLLTIKTATDLLGIAIDTHLNPDVLRVLLKDGGADPEEAARLAVLGDDPDTVRALDTARTSFRQEWSRARAGWVGAAARAQLLHTGMGVGAEGPGGAGGPGGPGGRNADGRVVRRQRLDLGDIE
jgi:ankyrin repeat protein